MRRLCAGCAWRGVSLPSRMALLSLTVAPLLFACAGVDERVAATRTVISASPTVTHTPSGDLLRIDGEIVRAVLIPDPAQAALYALTDTDLYHYFSGHWEATGAGNDGRHLLPDPTDLDRVLRGDHPDCDDPDPEPVRFEISRDGGLRWRVLFQGVNIRPLAFDEALPEVVYGSDCELAVSSTAGRTWLRFSAFDEHELIDVAPSDARLFIAGVTRGNVSQIRAVDVTDPESPIVGEPLLELPGRATIDAEDDRVVVGAADAVYISDDSGITWARSRIGLEGVTSSASPQPVISPSWEHGVQVIRIHPGNPKRLYAGFAHGLYVSQDDGVTWVRYNQIPIDANVTDIQFGLGGADLYVTTTNGVVVVPSP